MSLATVNQICVVHEAMNGCKKSEDSLKECFENVNISITGYSNSHKFHKNSLKTQSFPELEQMYWEEFKRRQILKEEMRKKVCKILSYLFPC